MQRIACLLVCVSCAAWSAGLPAAATAAPEFSECPLVGADTGCQYLISVTDLTTSLAVDPSQPSYANNLVATHETGLATDALIGIRNRSSRPVSNLRIAGPVTFEFDGDGLCDNGTGAVPGECQDPAGKTVCGADNGPCAFPPPPGEPTGYVEPGALRASQVFSNGDGQNGYEGPRVWFSNVAPSPKNSGTVNFSPALPPGATTYFSLEAAPKNLPFTTAVSAMQFGAGAGGRKMFLPTGVAVQSRALVQGGQGKVLGTMTFRLFRSRGCTGRASATVSTPVLAGAATSAPIALGRPGTYYWRVSYSGDAVNARAENRCGGSVVIVPRRGNAGLPASPRCVSRFTAALTVGGRRARSSLVFMNGRLLGRFGGRVRITVRHNAAITVIASSRRGTFGPGGVVAGAKVVQQSRMYRSC